jgi:hypothetical protein
MHLDMGWMDSDIVLVVVVIPGGEDDQHRDQDAESDVVHIGFAFAVKSSDRSHFFLFQS